MVIMVDVEVILALFIYHMKHSWFSSGVSFFRGPWSDSCGVRQSLMTLTICGDRDFGADS